MSIIDLSSISEYANKQKEYISTILNAATEKEITRAFSVEPRIYKFVINPQNVHYSGEYGYRDLRDFNIIQSDESEYLLKKYTTDTLSKCVAVMYPSGEVTEEYTVTITGTGFSSPYPYHNDTIQGILKNRSYGRGLISGHGAVTITFPCFDLGKVTVYIQGGACVLQVYCDDELLFNTPYNVISSGTHTFTFENDQVTFS